MNAVTKLLRSFKYAFEGLFYCIRTCRNFRIHTVAAVFVIFFSTFYSFSALETALIYFLIGIVIALECVNTGIEQLCDAITREYSPLVKIAKDVAAAAVLCSAVTSVAVAINLFWNPEVLLEIVTYFSSPLRFVLLIVCLAVSLIYIFYEDIFKHGKK